MNKFIFVTTIFNFLLLTFNLTAQNTRLWGTYYGGVEIGINENGNGTDTDPFGNVYITGNTSVNAGIATFGAFQTIYGGGNRDAILVKFDANGNRLWGTYYGLSDLESGLDVKTDNTGNVYLLANVLTGSIGLATPGAYQTASAGGTDALLVKFDANGNRLWATYFGGTGGDAPSRIAVDGQGNVYIVGITNGNNGIAFGGFQNTIGGGQDLFLAKFSPTGALLWSTYYGGSGNENGVPNVAVDCDNNVYITGTTTSTTNIAFNGFQNSLSGSTDAFLVKFDANGNRLWSTYYGGPGSPGIFGVSDIDRTLAIATDITGNVYITGGTTSTTNIAFNGHDNTYTPANPLLNQGVAYLAKFNSSGNRLWATYYGDDSSQGCSIATDICGNVYMSGTTSDLTPPADISTTNGFQTGSGDAFVVMFDSLGNRLWGTYYGGVGLNILNHLALDINSDIYLAGTTDDNSNIATAGAFDTTLDGVRDIFLAKFTTGGCAKYTGSNCPVPLTLTTTSVNDSCNGMCAGSATTIPAGGSPPYSYLWSNGDTTQTADSLCAGNYTVTVTDNSSNTVLDTVTITEPPLITFSQSFTGCQGFSITVGSNTYTTSGTFTDTIFGGSSSGCDSIVTTNLTINPISSGVDVITSCTPITWIDGNTYSASTTTPTDTIFGGAANGCDSIVTLNLTINNLATGIDFITSCTPITWIDGNTYSANTNTPTDTIFGGAANGCDSIVTLNLTINNAATGTDIVTSCTPITWIDGNTYSASTNTPTDTIIGGAANGCDSIVTLNLTITPAVTGNDVIVTCSPITWLDGNTYAVSTNTPTFTFIGGATNGCDSIVTLNLTINSAATFTDVQTICGTSFTWIDGNTYTSSTNTPTDTIFGGATNGCDSIVTLNLTLTTPTKTINVLNECEGFSVTVGSNTYTTTGVFTDVVNNCDTVITDLTIMPAPQLTLIKVDDNCGQNSGSVTAITTTTNPPIVYSWSTGATDSIISNLPSGTYSLIITDAGGCSDTAQILVNETEIDCDFFVYLPNSFTPNGDGNNDLFFVNGKGIESVSVKIFNRWGNKVFEINNMNESWDGTYKGLEQNTAVFVYVLNATFTNGKTVTESGNVSLIR